MVAFRQIMLRLRECLIFLHNIYSMVYNFIVTAGILKRPNAKVLD